jgi:aspartate racemase
VEYYSAINQAVNDHFGDNTNPPLVLFNVNQAEVHKRQREDNWNAVAQIFIEAAQCLERADVEAISFCANTPHKIYADVAAKVSVPIIHIADVTASAIQKRGLASACFIGTQYSMQDDFVTGRIASHGIDVSVPEDEDVIRELHRIIQQELTFNDIRTESMRYVIQQLQAMIDAGSQGAILGCTEFPLMLNDEDLAVPVFDTTRIHAAALGNFVLGTELS